MAQCRLPVVDSSSIDPEGARRVAPGTGALADRRCKERLKCDAYSCLGWRFERERERGGGGRERYIEREEEKNRYTQRERERERLI